MTDLGIRPLSELPVDNPFGFRLLADVPTKKIQWVWEPYIPRGALTLLMGDGGYGKSWLTCSVAADLSAGRALPGSVEQAPQRILMLGAEDGISEVIKPKMELLKANMQNIAASDRGLLLNKVMQANLLTLIKSFDSTIVFLDPLVVYMGGSIDMFRANETRSVLSLLSEVAKETNTAIVAVHHIRKSRDGTAQNRVMGSADFVNGVRSALMVDIGSGGQRYMAHVKSNWAKNGPSLAYNFGNEGFQWQGDYEGGDSDGPEMSFTPRGAAKSFLIDLLKDGPVLALDVAQRAYDEKFNERTLARAKKGVARSVRRDEKWYWELEPGLVLDLEQQGTVKTPEAKQAEGTISALAKAFAPKVEVVTETETKALPSSGNPVFDSVLAAARAKLAEKRAA